MVINITGIENDTKAKLLDKLNIESAKATFFDFIESYKNLRTEKTKERFIEINENTKATLETLKNELLLVNPKFVIMNNADYLNNDPAETVMFFAFSKDLIKNKLIFILSDDSLVIGSDDIAYFRIRSEDDLDETSSIINNFIRLHC
jgi:hypothetical protein